MHRTAFLMLAFSTLGGVARAQDNVWDLVRLSGGSYLGVKVAEIDAERARELKLKEERGVEIKKVEPDTPAEKAGLKEQDVVLEYNGQRVEGTDAFTRMVRETPVGRAAKMLVSRDGNHLTLTATIGQRKDGVSRSFNITIPPVPPVPPVPHIDVPRPHLSVRSVRIGIETESLTDQLAEFFGVKEGVLIRSVEKDSAAEKAGLKAGDVIVKIDGRTVKRPRDVTDELRSASEKKAVPFQVVRNKKEITVNLEMPDRARDRSRREIPGRSVRLEQDRL